MEQALKIKEICVAAGLWVATAESLTAGHVQALIASASGASNFFCGGITAYNIDQKVKHLGVDRTHAEQVNCVSLRVAEEMARGATRLFDADIGVATTGYAEPTGSPNASAAHAFYAIWDRRQAQAVRSGKLVLTEGRVANQREVAEHVLDELLAYLSA